MSAHIILKWLANLFTLKKVGREKYSEFIKYGTESETFAYVWLQHFIIENY